MTQQHFPQYLEDLKSRDPQQKKNFIYCPDTWTRNLWTVNEQATKINVMLTHDFVCSEQGRLACNTMQSEARVQTFRRNTLPPSSDLNFKTR